MKKLLWISATAMVFSASAIAQTTAYPEGAELMTPEALRAALAEKVFAISPAKGPTWRWQFDGNGYFFLNAGNYRDSGKWSIKESSLCLESRNTPGCNEIRQKDNVLYLKRDSGEIVKFEPK